jgi:hypothetical protein
MKAKALVSAYSDGSGFKVVRIYLEQDFDNAESDLELLKEHGSDSKNWSLEDVNVFNNGEFKRILNSVSRLPIRIVQDANELPVVSYETYSSYMFDSSMKIEDRFPNGVIVKTKID